MHTVYVHATAPRSRCTHPPSSISSQDTQVHTMHTHTHTHLLMQAWAPPGMSLEPGFSHTRDPYPFIRVPWRSLGPRTPHTLRTAISVGSNAPPGTSDWPGLLSWSVSLPRGRLCWQLPASPPPAPADNGHFTVGCSAGCRPATRTEAVPAQTAAPGERLGGA